MRLLIKHQQILFYFILFVQWYLAGTPKRKTNEMSTTAGILLSKSPFSNMPSPCTRNFLSVLQGSVLNKLTNKEKPPSKGTREEKRKDQSPNKRPHPKVQNAQRGENT
jgi:hypothetical protein